MNATVHVRVLSVDVVCDACGMRMRDVPPELGQILLDGHREPALSSVTTNHGVWRRRQP